MSLEVLLHLQVGRREAEGSECRVIDASTALFAALQATLFVRHPETGKLLVNFDPKILEVVRETKCMIKMKLDVPEQAKNLLKLESKLKADKLYLQVRGGGSP